MRAWKRSSLCSSLSNVVLMEEARLASSSFPWTCNRAAGSPVLPISSISAASCDNRASTVLSRRRISNARIKAAMPVKMKKYVLRLKSKIQNTTVKKAIITTKKVTSARIAFLRNFK